MKVPITADQVSKLKNAIPYWCMQFHYAAFLNSNHIASAGANDTYEFMVGVGHEDAKIYTETIALENNKAWKLGYLCFENNHQRHGIEKQIGTASGFEKCFFFEPQLFIALKKGEMNLEVLGADAGLPDEILQFSYTTAHQKRNSLNQRTSREEYLRTVQKIRDHIVEGDFYEMNYCMEFYSENGEINAPQVFQTLNSVSPTPFAAFFRRGDLCLLCASPERFLKRSGTKVIAQPIKGTERRSADILQDNMLKLRLQHSEKERAENVMIVDLMRNDLAQCAETGSVKVDELFGVYSFATVHQLISTISATLKEDVTLDEILACTYPMGSMTGAPKRAVIHAIDKYEPVPRNIFSGSVGYLDPEHNFDLNVVIRSIIYNSANHYLSFHVGSAITFDADPESEYAECLLKARTMFKALDIVHDLP